MQDTTLSHHATVEEPNSCGLNPEKVRNAPAKDDWRVFVLNHILNLSDGERHLIPSFLKLICLFLDLEMPSIVPYPKSPWKKIKNDFRKTDIGIGNVFRDPSWCCRTWGQ